MISYDAPAGQKKMLIGYARISTADQNLDLQIHALKNAGCEKITGSGAKSDRPKLGEALAFAREKDSIVVWKLDRLGRSLKTSNRHR